VTTPSPWPAGGTPYVTPDQLPQWTTGIQWSTIPPQTGASPAQLYAVQSMLCRQATTDVTQIVNQPLHCTETTEEISGPHYRMTVEWSSGNGRIIASRWPVTQVTNVQVSPANAWPRQWTVLPATNFEPEYPVDGLYGASSPSSSAGGQGILFAPGYVAWPAGWPGGQLYGRKRFRVAFTYFAGWPHASLTANASSGDMTLEVDDCAGWVLTGTNDEIVGAAGTIYDAQGGGQEAISVTASSAVKGPGTLTLASALNYDHQSLIMVSALPSTAIWATALLTAKAALTRGATATTQQTIGGKQQAWMHPLEAEARRLLNALKRTI